MATTSAAARWTAGLLAAAIATSLVAAAPSAPEQEDSLTAGLKVAFRAYQQCEQQQDAFSCLKLRALKSLDRAMKQDRIPLVDGLSLVQNQEGSRALTQDPPAEVDEKTLPEEAGAKQEKLDELLSDRVGRLLSGHSLQLDVPRYLVESRQLSLSSLVEEGRRKGGIGGGGGGGGGGMKKYGGLMMMGLMMKSGLMAMAYKAVALLAGKALMVAKIALVLSAVVGLSKLFGGGGQEKTTYEIVKHPHVSHAYTHSSSHEYLGHGGGGGSGGGGGHYEASAGGGGGSHGWGRSMDTPYPHLMAYRGQLPEGAVQPPAALSQQPAQQANA